jgi:ribonuclease HII
VRIKVLKNVQGSKFVVGLDEAGRGPVIGPMVIACVAFEPLEIPRLLDFGVQDSKRLSRDFRRHVYGKVVDSSSFVAIAVIDPVVIDEWVLNGEGLNKLEAKIIWDLTSFLPSDKIVKIFIDAPSNVDSFAKYLREVGLKNFVAENKADYYRPIVSAASIIAKVNRDEIIEGIKREIGIDFGSGYPSDPRTKDNLELVIKKRPDVVRRSWKTVSRF